MTHLHKLLCLGFLLTTLTLSAQDYKSLLLKPEQVIANKITSVEAILSAKDELPELDGSQIYYAHYREDGILDSTYQYLFVENRRFFHTEAHAFDDMDHLTSTTTRSYPEDDPSALDVAKWVYTYNSYGKKKETRRYINDKLLYTATHLYDKEGKELSENRVSAGNKSPRSNMKITYEYDEKGNQKRIIETTSNGKMTTRSMDAQGNINEIENEKERVTFVEDAITGTMLMNTYRGGELISSMAVTTGQPERMERANGLPKTLYWMDDVEMVWNVTYKKR